jgi:hypothetical protein
VDNTTDEEDKGQVIRTCRWTACAGKLYQEEIVMSDGWVVGNGMRCGVFGLVGSCTLSLIPYLLFFLDIMVPFHILPPGDYFSSPQLLTS